jgi:hypothetical protein
MLQARNGAMYAGATAMVISKRCKAQGLFATNATKPSCGIVV